MRRLSTILKSFTIPGMLSLALICHRTAQAQQTVGTGGGLGPTPGNLFDPPGNATPTPTATPAGGGAAASTAPRSTESYVPSPATNYVSGASVPVLGSTDVGDLLSKSVSDPGVITQFRNPIISDPRIRGYQDGQITTLADGAYFMPVRADLDTIVSKLDSGLIQSVTVIKGPYTVRDGPGFAFLDVLTPDTPRYENGFQTHGLTSLMYKTNGSQWQGRQSFWGGDNDWGFRVGYELLTGDNYQDAHGKRYPSGYTDQNVDAALGYSLSPDSRIEFKVLRQDLANTFLPGQAFNIQSGITDAYSLRYTLVNQDWFDALSVEGWYNYSRFNGNNLNPLLQQQIFPPPSTPFIGFTDGSLESIGYRALMTWGKPKEPQLTVGTDLRYVSQFLNEFDTTGTTTVGGTTTNNPIPPSHFVDPGVFADCIIPIGERLTLKAGVRADWASSNVDAIPDLPGQISYTDRMGTTDFGRTFDLWAAYVNAEYKLNHEWTATAGFGNALNPPTLTQLYADRPLLAVIQNGLNFTQGNPLLNPEQVRQVDLGVRANYETVRFGLNGYYAWIHDYITFAEIAPPTPPLLFNGIQYINTNRAELGGFETYGEWDILDWLTPFAVMQYVQGRDLTRDSRGVTPGSPQEPLPGIPPLDTRLGIRIHEGRKNPRWGVEFVARVVNEQTEVAQSLGEQATSSFVVFNMRSYWQVTPNFLLTGGVENFTNKFYREHLDLLTGQGVFEPGINFYFGAQLTY